MVYRWRCQRCPFSLWAADGDALADAIKSHLLEHAESNLQRDAVRTVWQCPYCGTQRHTYAGDGAIEAFETHLFEHVASRIETGAHVADDVGGTGSVLVVGQTDAPTVANARAHFLSRGDTVILVTAEPAARLRLLDRTLPSWPESTTVVTTAADPLAATDIDRSAHSLDVVTIDGRPDLSNVGETVTRVLPTSLGDGRLSVQFDILPEIVEKFELQSVFRFLHLLSSRLDQAGALSHYYLDPRRIQRASCNVLEQAFDLSITADGDVFRSETTPSD